MILSRIESFYEERKIPLHQLVKVGREVHGLGETAIKVAAKRIYTRIQAGEKIKDVRLAWLVWDEAKNIQVKTYQEVHKRVTAIRAENDKLKENVKYIILAYTVTVLAFCVFHFRVWEHF